VTSERLLGFRHSSLPLFTSKKRPPELEPATILTESGGLTDSAAGWRRYLDYLGVIAEEEVSLREEKFGRLSRGWVIGSKAFRTELKKGLAESGAAQERFGMLGAEIGAHREIRAELWEEKLTIAAKALAVSLTDLPALKSAPGKVQLATIMKATTSVSNGWLAERLGMGEPATVSQYVRRFQLQDGTATRAFKRALSRVKP
jgi:hypothetical protein